MALKKSIYLFLILTLCHTAHPRISQCGKILSAVELEMFKDQKRKILHKIIRLEPEGFINFKSVLFMLQNDVNPNDTDAQGNTTLHILIDDAIALKKPINLYVIHILLLYGANPRLTNREGQSVLDKAFAAPADAIPNKEAFCELLKYNNPRYL